MQRTAAGCDAHAARSRPGRSHCASATLRQNVAAPAGDAAQAAAGLERPIAIDYMLVPHAQPQRAFEFELVAYA
jgi:hypothetical protein